MFHIRLRVTHSTTDALFHCCNCFTQHRVTATAFRADANGVFPSITERLPATATATTLRGLLVNRKYVVEVRSLTGTDLSAPRFATPVPAAT
jgi:hypothetical protein